jgi:methylmalonyl-CoA/ethylmalonyl-CoA epimerase
MPDRITLDHVAHAVDSHDLVLPRYAADLGGRYVGRGDGPGFSPFQVRFANDAKVEVLQPHQPERFPFLRRFLDRRGPGLHHVTFKVPDIHAAIAAVEGAGMAVVDVDVADAHWKEAFVHPKSALGFLVQLAQVAGEGGWRAEPADFPPPAQAADLVRVVLAVGALDAGLGLYRDVLGGEVVDEGDAWVDLDHGGGMGLRLWQPRDPAVLAGAAGRADHLVFRVADPAAVRGAVEGEDGWEVPAGANHGARLALVSAD